jgi:urease accessory protein
MTDPLRPTAPAPHLAQTYLGNLQQDAQLATQLTHTDYLEVKLAPSDCGKGRIYTQTTQGDPIGIMKDRQWILADGDVLQTTTGQLVVIHLQAQKVMVLRIDHTIAADHALALIHLGHTLGNHHWPILLEADKIYVQPSENSAMLEDTLQGFQIPGLTIDYEMRSPTHSLSFSHHQHPL